MYELVRVQKQDGLYERGYRDDVNVDNFVKCPTGAFHDLTSTLFWCKIFLKMLSIRIF